MNKGVVIVIELRELEELKELREFKKDILENIDGLSQLLKYSEEMAAVTRYQGGDKPNIEEIRRWIVRVKNKRYKEC